MQKRVKNLNSELSLFLNRPPASDAIAKTLLELLAKSHILVEREISLPAGLNINYIIPIRRSMTRNGHYYQLANIVGVEKYMYGFKMCIYLREGWNV
jgi:hypothetical protein